MLHLIALTHSIPNIEISPDGLSLSFSGDGMIDKAFARSKGSTNEIESLNINGSIDLGEGAFESFTSLTNVFLSDSITNIGSNCFRYCTSLKSFKFPKDIQIINDGIFDGCTSLEAVRINSSVNKIYTTFIFRNCSSLEYFDISLNNQYFSTDDSHHFLLNKNGSIIYSSPGIKKQIIPSTVTIINSFSYHERVLDEIDFSTCKVSTISSRAFSNVQIKELIFPPTLKRIESSAFYQSLIDVISLPSSVSYFDKNALNEIIYLGNFLVEDSEALTSINGYVMNAKESMIFFVDPKITLIEISRNITFIEPTRVRNPNVLGVTVRDGNNNYSSDLDLLYNDDGTILKACPGGKSEAVLSSKCKKIDNSAFQGCNIVSIVLNEGLEAIEQQALMSCYHVSSLNIPSSLIYSNHNSFRYMNGSELELKFGPNFNTLGNAAFSHSIIKSVDFSLCIELKQLKDSTFINCSIKSIKLPPFLEKCEDNLFSYSGLESIEFPATTEYLKLKCFYECKNLHYVNISNVNITEVPESCFESSSIISIELPSSVRFIFTRAFAICNNLELIKFPKNSALSAIYPYVIESCNKLKNFTIPSEVVSISDGAFASAHGLLDFIMTKPSSHFQVIEGVLFTDNQKTLFAFPAGRSDASINESVESIRAFAFAGCNKLRALKFGAESKIKFLGESTFFNCSSLEAIVLPGSLQSFASTTFSECLNILSVHFNGESRLKEIPEFSFRGCSKLVHFDFQNVELIGESAFEGSAIRSLVLSNISILENKAFFNCKELGVVLIRSSLSHLGKNTFDWCTKLKRFSYCGDDLSSEISFAYCSLSYVYVGSNFNGTKFGNLPILKVLDGDCMLPTHNFTDGPAIGFLGLRCLQNLIGCSNEYEDLSESK